MGTSVSKRPPSGEWDVRILLSYNLEERHCQKLWRKFVETDVDCNGFWTVTECYRLIQEPRLSQRAPIIDALFFFADSKGEGSLGFQDFLVAFTSFCALSTEEVLQLFFMIVDSDRNGKLEKEELIEYFSYCPAGAGDDTAPVFPVNNKNALDKFRGGKWLYLEFDGLAQLCERFPYISYPAFHVQELYRNQLIGQAFWERVNRDRMKVTQRERTFETTLPGSAEPVKIEHPGRCTMKEILEYSRRKTAVQGGRRVAQPPEQVNMTASHITKLRDDQISRTPLLNMIRNPRCMYHVPLGTPPDLQASQRQVNNRPELELPGIDDDRPKTGDTNMNSVMSSQAEQSDTDSSSWSDDESEPEVEQSGIPPLPPLAPPAPPARKALPDAGTKT